MSPAPKEIRTRLINLDTGDGIILQYEPPEITGAVRVAYGGEPALAQPHDPMIYTNTSSETFPITMRWERIPLASLLGITPDEASDRIDKARNFVRSLAASSIQTENTLGGSTPLLFLEVPGVLSVYCKLENIDWTVRKRDPQTGRIMSLEMRVTFKEAPEYWYSSEELNVLGYKRT